MDDVLEDLDEPLAQANLAAKASVIVRAGALDLSSGTGSFRVREMMDRIATSLGIYVRSDVNLTDIEASCSDGANRVTEVVDLPTVGVNTERIWLMEHFTDWLCVNLGRGGSYHRDTHPSSQVIGSLPNEKKSAVAPFPDVIGDADGQTLPSPPEAAGQTDAIGQAGSAGQTGAGSASGVTVRQAHERLDAIEYRHKLYKIGMQVLAAAVSCASFTFLLGEASST